jgi:DNA-directed RNA polymerase specialized sigma24 family protein
MKNYKNSDYALNKYSDGIVYRFAEGSTVTVTLANYLADNPDRTEEDFKALKKISDAIYFRQDRAENAQTKKNTPLSGLKANMVIGQTLEDTYFDSVERGKAVAAFERLMTSSSLTETQKRRFRLYIIEGLSHRKIAQAEGVAVRAITQSLDAAKKKLKNIFDFF